MESPAAKLHHEEEGDSMQEEELKHAEVSEDCGIHLFCFLHGLHGKPKDFSFLREKLNKYSNSKQERQHKHEEDEAKQQEREEDKRRKKQELTSAVRVHIVKANADRYTATHDGIDVCAHRAADEIIAVIQNLENEPHDRHHHRQQQREQDGGKRRVRFISFVGYSLGGVYGRYLVKVLADIGLFDRICPMNFVSLGSPHLGSQQHAKVFPATLVFGTMKWLLGRTGHQLLLEDTFVMHEHDSVVQKLSGGSDYKNSGSSKREKSKEDEKMDVDDEKEVDGQNVKAADAVPLLVLLTRPSFTDPLLRFSNLSRYANIQYDIAVHYSTAAIRTTNPYRAFPANQWPTLKNYPTIVDSAAFAKLLEHQQRRRQGQEQNEEKRKEGEEVAVAAAIEEGEDEKEQLPSKFADDKDKHSVYLREMYTNLRQLPWQEFDVIGALIRAHGQLVCRNKFHLDGEPTLDHLIHNLVLP